MQDIDTRPDDAITDSPGVPSRQRFRFSVSGLLMLTSVVAIAIWLAGVTGILVATLTCVFPIAAFIDLIVSPSATSREPVAGRAKARRIALWYSGMAITGLAAYVGCAFAPAWWSPLPDLALVLFVGVRGPLSDFNSILFISGFAMLAYICLDGPLLRAREIRRLPIRSTIVFVFYSVTSAIYMVFAFKIYPPETIRDLIIPFGINLVLIGILWTLWWILRSRWNVLLIIAWNTALVSWLFWFAHPTMLNTSP